MGTYLRYKNWFLNWPKEVFSATICYLFCCLYGQWNILWDGHTCMYKPCVERLSWCIKTYIPCVVCERIFFVYFEGFLLLTEEECLCHFSLCKKTVGIDYFWVLCNLRGGLWVIFVSLKSVFTLLTLLIIFRQSHPKHLKQADDCRYVEFLEYFPLLLSADPGANRHVRFIDCIFACHREDRFGRTFSGIAFWNSNKNLNKKTWTRKRLTIIQLKTLLLFLFHFVVLISLHKHWH